MPSDAPYSISDLARLTGLSVRTIRYYLAQGLIPASGESGPGAHYGEGHLGRLRLVRRLQQEHLPLAEIRERLASLTDADVVALVAPTASAPSQPETSALDYVRSVLAGAHRTAPSAPQPGRAPMAPPPPAAAMPRLRDAPAQAPWLLREVVAPFAGSADEAAAGPAAPPAAAAMPSDAQPAGQPAAEPAFPSIERSQWERLSLGPNLELHVRRPLGRLEQKRVERLITIARQVLKEEQP